MCSKVSLDTNVSKQILLNSKKFNIMDAHGVAHGIPIPKQLIYEELNGLILYRKGYQDVLNQTKTIEAIMGCGSLQSIIISLLLRYLYTNLDENEYEIATNEAGLHLSLGNNLSADIALYSLAAATAYELNKHYFNIPPKIVIEVDVSIALDNISDIAYIHQKIQALFDFGVERVLWVLTADKKILIAEPNQDWILRDWAKEVQLMDGHTFNLMQMIQKKGYKI
jgi:Uma2 family endonuclease